MVKNVKKRKINCSFFATLKLPTPRFADFSIVILINDAEPYL